MTAVVRAITRARRRANRPHPGRHLGRRRVGDQRGEHRGPVAAHRGRVAGHHGEVGADPAGEVGLVDDEQIGAGDAGAALARDLVAAGHVDHEHLAVDEPVG